MTTFLLVEFANHHKQSLDHYLFLESISFQPSWLEKSELASLVFSKNKVTIWMTNDNSVTQFLPIVWLISKKWTFCWRIKTWKSRNWNFAGDTKNFIKWVWWWPYESCGLTSEGYEVFFLLRSQEDRAAGPTCQQLTKVATFTLATSLHASR